MSASRVPDVERDGANLADAIALDEIALMLCDPEWGAGMLEDIAFLISRTGRDVDGDGSATWVRH